MIDTSRTGDGPSPAQIMLVGEYWGEEEVRAKAPFMGASGQLLNSLLHSAGIMRSECYCTNLVNAPLPWGMSLIAGKKKDVTSNHVPFEEKFVRREFIEARERLGREISSVSPNIIIALGNATLFALTGKTGILRWRGSQLHFENSDSYTKVVYPIGTVKGPVADAVLAYSMEQVKQKVIPTLNPAAVLREMSFRPIVINDLRRAARERNTKGYTNVPQWNFIIRPSADRALGVLGDLLAQVDSGALSWIDFDLETAYGHVTCAGISWSRYDAISIPFTTGLSSYFNETEEAAILFALYRLLTHPRVKVRGQNLLYDCQYTYRHWHFVPRVAQDTMITHHTCFAGMRKSLDFQASMYCDHYVQWKPERTAWKEGG